MEQVHGAGAWNRCMEQVRGTGVCNRCMEQVHGAGAWNMWSLWIYDELTPITACTASLTAPVAVCLPCKSMVYSPALLCTELLRTLSPWIINILDISLCHMSSITVVYTMQSARKNGILHQVHSHGEQPHAHDHQ